MVNGNDQQSTEESNSQEPGEDDDVGTIADLGIDRREVMKAITATGAGIGGITALTGEALGATLCVDPNDDSCHDTIQAAVNAASSGDVIEVAQEEYNETVNIDKSLILRGAPGDSEIVGADSNAPILDGSGLRGNAFFILDGVSNVTIEGFEMRNYSASSNRGLGHGVAANNRVNDITIRNNTIHDIEETGVVILRDEGDVTIDNISVIKNSIESFGAYGIRVSNADNSTIKGNEIRGQDGHEDPFEGGISEIGIQVQAQRKFDFENEITVDSVLVEDNVVEGPFDRVGIEFIAHNKNEKPQPVKLTNIKAVDNTVSNADTWGIAFTAFKDGTIDEGTAVGNQVTDCETTGIHIGTFDTGNFGTFEIRDNTVSRNRFGIGTGTVTGGATISVIDNEVTDNQFGISVGDLTEGSLNIRENIVQNNATGVDVQSSASASLVTINFNDLIDNSDWAVRNTDTTILDAEFNWWGHEDGPSGEGPGDGDKVSTNVDFMPWLTQTVRTVILQPKDVRGVQKLEDTRVVDPENDEILHGPLQPEFVEAAPTTIIFGLDVENIDALNDPDRVVIKYEVTDTSGDTEELGSFELFGEEIQEIANANNKHIAAEKLVDVAGNNLPMTLAQQDTDFATIKLVPTTNATHINGIGLRIEAPGTLATMPTLNIGFIEIRDPDGGSNYGSNTNGRVADYDIYVDGIIEYLKRVWPISQSFSKSEWKINYYQHDEPIDGKVDFLIPPDLNEDSEFEDAQKARDKLDTLAANDEAGGIDDFDVTLAFVPDGYFDYHGEDSAGIHHQNEDTQPQSSAIAMERSSSVGVVTTGAQEIGHHFLPDPTYPEIMQRRDDNEDLDPLHARSEETWDPETVVTVGYDLVTSEPDSGPLRTDFMTSSPGVRLERNSFMAFSPGENWGDIHEYNKLVEKSKGKDNFTPYIPETETDEDPTVFSGIGKINDDNEVEITRLWKRPGVPMANSEKGTVSIKLKDPTDQLLAEFTTLSQTVKALDGAGGAGKSVVEGAFFFTISFPVSTSKIQFKNGEKITEINPIERGVREAIEMLPDSGFINRPDERREALFNKLDAIDEQMEEEKFRAAKRKMKDDIRSKINRWLKDDYDTTGLQPSKEEMLDIIDDMIERLEILAQTSNSG